MVLGNHSIAKLLIAVTVFHFSIPLSASNHACFLRLLEEGRPSSSALSPINKSKLLYDGKEYNLPNYITPSIKDKILSLDVSARRKHAMLKLIELTFEQDPSRHRLEDTLFAESERHIVNAAMRGPNAIMPKGTAEVTIVTHQEIDRQEATAQVLNSNPKLKDVYTIGLNSAVFPLESESLLTRFNQVQYSVGGEAQVVLPKTVGRVNLMGGNCGACLLSTMTDLVAENVVNSEARIPLELVVHSHYAYTGQRSLPTIAHTLEVKAPTVESIKADFGLEELLYKFWGDAYDIKGPIQPLDPSIGYRFELRSRIYKHRKLYLTLAP